MRAESQLPPRGAIPSTLSDRPLAGWTEIGVLGRSESGAPRQLAQGNLPNNSNRVRQCSCQQASTKVILARRLAIPTKVRMEGRFCFQHLPDKEHWPSRCYKTLRRSGAQRGALENNFGQRFS
jgi:hypothetical protein